MRTIPLLKQGKTQSILLPADMAYEGIGELEISRCGDIITLRPVRPDWLSLANAPSTDDDFLRERPDIVSDQGRVLS